MNIDDFSFTTSDTLYCIVDLSDTLIESMHRQQLIILFSWSLLFIYMLPTCITHSDHLVSNTTKMNESQIVKACHRRMKRSTIIDYRINALNTLINEHHIMINYLVNTSLNATFIKHYINDHYQKTSPSLRSWRDVTDLICLTILLGILLYYLFMMICRVLPYCRCRISSSKHSISSTVKRKKQFEQELREFIRNQIQQQDSKNYAISAKNFTIPPTLSLLSNTPTSHHEYV